MCLAVPMEIKSIKDNIAEVEVGGVKNQVRLDIIDEPPQVGDFVIVHAGFALRRLDREEGLETLKLFQEGLNLELT
ncbi:HypC/HybG/HupF family hydrogenase formation chaperone [Desulfohalobiaceae bacterium Ax17]|uniref:HypC/HybG/HupF family hydrogenase formation chaperone n=1 Tax=Desulfovulcanus ferrireducens TaxID=2831190 RepID=UPI00207BC3E5|nr:HypC/HybG/HupF family hydrogenase formation chaperone [Desulfovulcanus ferrireducens]MBT8762530.1 HypC/HybG/HupF family hydrogenase formation chaperone [Desulfovulcanus ferrireducens]